MIARFCRQILCALVALGSVASFDASAVAFDCESPKALQEKFKLPNLKRAMRDRKDIVIVAIGSSSTKGTGASDPSKSYPSQLSLKLASLWPQRNVTVVNSGIGGENERDMMARFQKDVIDFKPDLIIWQVGSNTILQGRSIEDYTQSLRDGLEKLRMTKADIILMDPQYAPMINSNPISLKFVDAMYQLADSSGVNIFQRYTTMRYWVEKHLASIDELISRDGLHMNDASYHCVADLLAAKIQKSVKYRPEIYNARISN